MPSPRRPFVVVVGARPNLMKAAPLLRGLTEAGLSSWVVHTGQHYDHEMSRVFFEELDIPEPDAFLGVGSGSHGVQTATALIGLEKWLLQNQVDALLAIGDVNSTLAAALAAAKLHVPVVHVEAGYRSGDMRMPEEINRLVTDHVSDLLLPPTRDAHENLIREGIPAGKVDFVGNLMAETFLRYRDIAADRQPWQGFRLERGQYAVVTIHRPENTDDLGRLQQICRQLETLSMPLVWPVHPRLRDLVESEHWPSFHLTNPLPYLQMLGLIIGSAVVVTDSGGVQEEACLAGVPCVTVRTTTERVATIQSGANRLVEPEDLAGGIDAAMRARRGWETPEHWDTGVSGRVAASVRRLVDV